MSLLLCKCNTLAFQDLPGLWVVCVPVCVLPLTHVDEDKGVAADVPLIVAILIATLELLVEAEVGDDGSHDGVVIPFEIIGGIVDDLLTNLSQSLVSRVSEGFENVSATVAVPAAWIADEVTGFCGYLEVGWEAW